MILATKLGEISLIKKYLKSSRYLTYDYDLVILISIKINYLIVEINFITLGM